MRKQCVMCHLLLFSWVAYVPLMQNSVGSMELVEKGHVVTSSLGYDRSNAKANYNISKVTYLPIG